MKTLKIVLIIILSGSAFLLCRKYDALSNQRLLEYGWKAYNENCESDAMKITEEDLNKIGKEWKLTYRWVDNAVFLHIKNNNSPNDCVYICK